MGLCGRDDEEDYNAFEGAACRAALLADDGPNGCQSVEGKQREVQENWCQDEEATEGSKIAT